MKKNRYGLIFTAVALLLLTSACGKKKSSTTTRVVNTAGTTIPTNYNNQTGTFNNACGTQLGANCNMGLPQGATCESFPGYQTDPYTGQCVSAGGAVGGYQQQPQQYQYPQTQQGYGYGMQYVGNYQGYRVFYDPSTGNYYYTF